MDSFTETLLDNRLKGMIDKGSLLEDIVKNVKKNKAIYFVVVREAAALISKSIIKC